MIGGLAKSIGGVVGDVLGPRRNAQGNIQFVPLFHDVWMQRSDDYRAWWGGLDDLERARFHRQLEELDATERERDTARRAQLDREAQQAEERARVAPYVLMRRRGVPEKDHVAIAAGDLDDTSALASARAFLASAMRVLVLSGPKGCGKTTAAGWLVAQDVPAPPSYGDPRWHPEPRFLDVSKLARLSRYKAEEIEPIEICTLLAIDDLGMEYADEKGSFLATLDGVFNARYAAGLRTVITTNLPARAFKERYGERIADRIREVGRFVELNAQSLRGRREP